MIKLKELIELKSMVYTETIKPKHKERLSRPTPNFHEGIILPKATPPDNDSARTLKEIKYLASIKKNEYFAESMDKVGDVFKSASWNSAAKHARGNIFDDNQDYFEWTGPNYLK